METERMNATRWVAILSTIVGAWLVIAPFILAITGTAAMSNTIIIGVIVVALSLYQLATPEQGWVGWVNLLAAIWLVAFPYLFNPPEAIAYVNAVWCGIILGILSLADIALAVPDNSSQSLHSPL